MGQLLTPDVINSCGLALDIAGVVLLFFFGLPSETSLEGVMTWSGHGTSKDYRRARVFSRLGLALLVAGFGLQIASNHVGARAPAALPVVSCPQAAN